MNFELRRRPIMEDLPMSLDVEMDRDLKNARRLAQQVRDTGQPRTWRKVTTVMSDFEVYRLTDSVRKRITEAFVTAGLHCEPSVMTIERSARIRLSVNKAEVTPATSRAFTGLQPGITVWERRETRWVPASDPEDTRGVLLVDVDLSLVERSESIYGSIPSRLRGMDDEALEDVLTPDHRASFKRAIPGEATRQASLFVVAADEKVALPTQHAASADDNPVLLSLALIEFAVGPDWILVARHPPQIYASGSPADHLPIPAQSADDYIALLQGCGLGKARSAEAAALAVITQAVDSFGTARTELASYVDTWRTEFVKDRGNKSILINLQATLPIVIDALEPLRRPTVVDWLSNDPRDRARQLTDHVDRNLDALHNLQTTTSDALAQADQHQNELYQGGLATLAAVLLAPGLVASIFGANDILSDSPMDLVWLFIAMALAGIVTRLVIQRSTRRRHNMA